MAYKYRDEIVGKRFLSVRRHSKLKYTKISDWEWRSGFIRAVSHKDCKHPELSILVEFDDTDWKSRDWVRLYQDDAFDLFLVENTLVWTPRSDAGIDKHFYWPSLTFKSLLDKSGLPNNSGPQPVEYLVDKELGFVDYADLVQYQDADDTASSREFVEVQKAIKQWTEYQDGQRILVTTPSVLVGYRVEVYRVEGTTQWYTAVIISYNDTTRELTLTDDTVLEEHYEDPCLVQMKLIGDGVVESILKGENIGITPRRRTCASQQNYTPVHYCTRTRSHHPAFLNSRLSSFARRTRQRPLSAAAAEENHNHQETTPTTKATSVPVKVAGQTARNSQSNQASGGRGAVRRKRAAEVRPPSSRRGGGERRRRNSKQKRTSVKKVVCDIDSAAEVECNLQRTALSATPEHVTVGDEKNTKSTDVSPNGHGSHKIPPCESEAASKLQLAVEPVKEPFAKDGIDTPEPEKLISTCQVPSKTEWSDLTVINNSSSNSANSHNLSTGDNSNSISSPIKPLSITTTVSSSISVVLTPLSPTVVKLKTNPADHPSILQADSNSGKSKNNNIGASATSHEKSIAQNVGSIEVSSKTIQHIIESKHQQLSDADSSGLVNVSKSSSESAVVSDTSVKSSAVIKSFPNSPELDKNTPEPTEVSKILPDSPVSGKRSLESLEVRKNLQDSSVINLRVQESPVVGKSSQESPVVNESSQDSPVLNKSSQEPPVVNQNSQEPPVVNESSLEPPVVSESSQEPPVVSESSQKVSVVNESSQKSPVISESSQESAVVNKSSQKSPVVSESLQETTVVNNSLQEPSVVNESSQEPKVVCESSQKSPVVSEGVEASTAVNKSSQEPPIVNKSLHDSSVVNENLQKSPVNKDLPQDSPGVSQNVLDPVTVSKSLPSSPVVNKNLPDVPITSKSLPSSPIVNKNLPESPVSSESLPDSSVTNHSFPEISVASKCSPVSPIVSQSCSDQPLVNGTLEIKQNWLGSQLDSKTVLQLNEVNQSVLHSTKSKTVLQSASTQESCQRDLVISCAKTLRNADSLKDSLTDVSHYSLKSVKSDTKGNTVVACVPKTENFPKSSYTDVNTDCSISAVGKLGGKSCDKEFINETAPRIKKESEPHFKAAYDGFANAFPEPHSVLRWKQENRFLNCSVSSQNLANERKYSDRNIIVSVGQHKHSSYKSTSLTVGQNQGDLKNFDHIPRTEGHHAAPLPKSNDYYSGSNGLGMSHVSKTERNSEKFSSSQSHLVVPRHSTPNHRLHHPTVNDHRTISPRTPTDSSGNKERSRSEEKRNASHLQIDRHESVKVYRDPLLVSSGPGVRHVDCLHHGLMHPAGISHSAAAAAAAVYPRVAALPQHSRNPGAPMPPSPLGPYSLSSHLLPPPHVAGPSSATAPPPPGSHMDQHAAAMHSQAYRHLMTQHPLMPTQYGGAAGPHVGIDLMWQQKYNPNPWVMAQYEELRLERERVIAQERERNRLERDRREDIERADREKVEREKIEKERQERERHQKEQQQRQDRERLDREERERAQREVQQHFEESLRLALQKQTQLHQKSVGWSPMASLSLGKTQPGIGRSSPTVSQSLHPSDHDRDKVRDKEKERLSMEARMRHEQERWLAAVQRSEPVVAHSSSHPQNYSSVDPRSGNAQTKQELYSISRSSPHAVTTVGHHSNKSGIVPSPVVSSPVASNVPSSQHKSETNFSLYGYQPFQHTYITHAQLKAREETKGSNNMQPMIVSGKQSSPNVAAKHEKEIIYERPSTPGNSRTSTPIGPGNMTKQQMKLMHQGQERASPMYQPLVGSGGAFKPYEFSNSSPAPPAHQNSSSPTMAGRIGTPHFHNSQQDQPQNLVKGDHKGSHDQTGGSLHNHQRYDSRDVRQNISTPPCSIPSSYTPPYSTSKSTSPAASTNYSYNLIQQGLVPNPLYIAATHSGSSPSLNTSVAASCNPQSKSCASSPPVPQQFPRATSGAGITSGTPVCRSNSVSYSNQGRGNHNYSPVGHIPNQAMTINPNRTCPQEAHGGNRAHGQGTGPNHRSPSPAHLYGSMSSSSIQTGIANSSHHSRGPNCSSPRLTTNLNSSQVQVLHRMSGHPNLNPTSVSPSQTALSDSQVLPLNLQGNNVMGKRKAVKDINHKKRQKTNEENLLPPQLHPQVQPTSDNSVRQIGTPPNLLSNSSLLSATPYSGGNVMPSPNSAEDSPNQPLTRPESSTPSAMPELLGTSATTSVGCINASTFIDSYRSFVTTPHEGQNLSGKHKVQSKSVVENPVSDAVENLSRPSSSNALIPNSQSIPTIIISHEGGDESRMTVSPASSASSTITSGSGTGGSSNHTKLKKAWLQRHSENEDKKTPLETLKVDSPTKAVETEESKENSTFTISTKASSNSSGSTQNTTIKNEENSVNGPDSKNSKTDGQLEEDSTSSASEMEEEVKFAKRKLRISRKQGSTSPSSKKQKLPSAVNEATVEEPQTSKKENRKKNLVAEKEAAINSRRRGRKTKGKNAVPEDEPRNQPPKPLEKPTLAQLKKTGEAFLQDGPCCEVAPRLPKCRECRMTPHQRSKKMPNIFCRFYAFRKLRYGKNGTILSAGFSEPSDATDDDLKLWLPPVESPPSDIEIETSKFLLTHVGDQFCDLVEMEKEAQTLHMSDTTTITWKRVVQGVREMCDVCETTLFNIHWVCHKCGFVVCIDCYKARKTDFVKDEDSSAKDKDEYQWLLCTNRQPHEQDKLMITQIIANTALWDVGKMLHEVRRKWNIPTYCNCNAKDGDPDGKHSTNGICKLMSAVTKCFSSDKDSNQVNGLAESSRQTRKGSKGSSVNGVKQEDGISGYSSESGGSPLSWLADVALNSSSKIKDEKKKKSKTEGDDEKSSDNQTEQTDGFGESDDDKNENFSTLRELLIRPMGKMGAKDSGTDSSSQKTLTSTLDEVISCVIEQRVRKSDKKYKEKQLLHFTRKHRMLRSGRELLPIRSCTITESSLLYPEIPHVWLGCGKILLLTDPYHSGNMQMFQEQWKRGQPVIVSDVGQKLSESLWTPESFIRDFGDVKIDFFDCIYETVIPNQSMKKFWEGFENTSKRMKDEKGQALVLKLKDWPPSEEFSELLPARYQDFMKVLPLPQYTNRDGMFNMASRLPDCFVRPDLGPRMYNAYGLASCNKGSTNLHLDISDAVNILARVSSSSGEMDEDLNSEILKAIEASGCDSLMKKRAQEGTSKVGAIWHIYNARDADKIRDLLNKVSEEQGAMCDPHHDPIHNHEWYLNEELRDRLYKEYSVKAYVIIQNIGDAIFIPAGSPHQVRNLKSCVKVSEDFISPESVAHSFFLTQEIRNLPDGPINQEDKLQIKNVIYHAVKDALALLQSCDPEDSKS